MTHLNFKSIPKYLSVGAMLLLAAMVWPVWGKDALEGTAEQDALDQADPAEGALRKPLPEPTQAPAGRQERLYLFLTLDGPDGAHAIQAGRAFERAHPDVAFEPVLLADMDLLRRLQDGAMLRDHPDLLRRLQALSESGDSLPMVGTVPLARRFGITRVPTFVLVAGGAAHRIAGVPELEGFHVRALGREPHQGSR